MERFKHQEAKKNKTKASTKERQVPEVISKEEGQMTKGDLEEGTLDL